MAVFPTSTELHRRIGLLPNDLKTQLLIELLTHSLNNQYQEFSGRIAVDLLDSFQGMGIITAEERAELAT